MNLNAMKDRIEQMSKNYQIEVARLLINTHNIAYDENQNGLFINMAQMTEEVKTSMQQFIEYVDLQEQQLNADETEKDGLKDIFFKKE
jgi:aspartate/tyrosine/aromatic aminotransferase